MHFLPVPVSKLFSILFADDTNLFLSHKDCNEAIRIMNNELQKIVEWLHANKLSLNVEKTHYIIFSSNSRKHGQHKERLYINRELVDMVEFTKFLIIDCKMNWFKHIQHIKVKISKGIGVLCKARKVFKEQTLLTLYQSLIYPHLSYCVSQNTCITIST